MTLDEKKAHARITAKKYYDEHRDRVRELGRTWREKNREKILAQSRERRKEYRARVLQALGGKCASCGISDERVLQIDHVNGGGNKEYKREGNHDYSYYRRILEKNCEGYQLLCANCNWIKRYENGEWK